MVRIFKNAEGFAKKKNGKPKDLNMDKLPPTEGAFFQHYLRSVVQERISHDRTKARINHLDPEVYGWKPSDERFIAIATEDGIVPELLDGSQATAQRDRASASQMVSLARIFVVTATNFVKILIQRISRR